METLHILPFIIFTDSDLTSTEAKLDDEDVLSVSSSRPRTLEMRRPVFTGDPSSHC